ncbi:MAG: hypothetical protein ACI363_04065 [Phocaeicola plebeius]
MRIIFFIVCVMLLGRVMWQSEFQMTKEQEGLLWENVEALGYSVYHYAASSRPVPSEVSAYLQEVSEDANPFLLVVRFHQ